MTSFPRTAPLRIAYLLFPAFTALDVFGPLGALNILSIQKPMTLSLVSDSLSPVSADRTIVDGKAAGMLGNSSSPMFSQLVMPTNTLADDFDADVIIVPGGSGARNLPMLQPHIEWLRKHYDQSKYVLTVCTGAALLAETGKMAGKNATTNKRSFDWVKSLNGSQNVNWITHARWVVDGKLWTSSGVSAGVDMTLGFIEHLYGTETREKLRLDLEWNALNQTQDPFAGHYGLV